jgi:hypothetical protein
MSVWRTWSATSSMGSSEDIVADAVVSLKRVEIMRKLVVSVRVVSEIELVDLGKLRREWLIEERR